MEDLGKEIFLGVQTYLKPLTNWVSPWTIPQGVMKGLDEKVTDVEARIYKILRDVTVAAAAEGMAKASPLQHTFGGLGLGSNLTAGVSNSTSGSWSSCHSRDSFQGFGR